MKTIDDLRAHLFQTLEALSSKEDPMDIVRAKTISDVAQTIISSAKVEVDFAKVTGENSSRFLPSVAHPPGLSAAQSAPGAATHGLTTASAGSSSTRTAHGTKTVTQLAGGGSVTRHVMK